MVLVRHRTNSLWRTKSWIPTMQNSFWSLFQGTKLKLCNHLLKSLNELCEKPANFSSLGSIIYLLILSMRNFETKHFFMCMCLTAMWKDCVIIWFFFKGVIVFVGQSTFTHYCCSWAQKCYLYISHTTQWNQRRYFMTKHWHINYSSLKQYSLLQNGAVKRQCTQV